MKSNLNLLTVPLCVSPATLPPFRGDNVLLHLYGSEGDVLEDTLQKSLCTSVEEARDSYEDWVLICLLSKNGSPYFFFPLFAFLRMPHFSYLKISESLPGGWIESLTCSLR